MKNKKLILALALMMILALFAGCTQQDNIENNAEEVTEDAMENKADMDEEMSESEDEELELTLDELKMYDGTNGNPAYIAYEGVIYDVTNDSNWKSGSHGGNMAGTDITEKLKNAPHGISKLNSLEEVGKLKD